MRARRLTARANYGPKVLLQAFDEAWEVIAPHCGGNFFAAYATRLKLANAILSLARGNRQDVEAMKEAALRLLGFGRS